MPQAQTIAIPGTLVDALTDAAFAHVHDAAHDIAGAAETPGREISSVSEPIGVLARTLGFLQALERDAAAVPASHVRTLLAVVQTARETAADIYAQGLRTDATADWSRQETTYSELMAFAHELTSQHYERMARDAEAGA